MSLFRLAAVAPLAAFAGCASTGSTLAPAQIDAIESHRIDAPPDATFRAAASVMLDRGMVFTLSDAGAGLVGGRHWESYAAPTADHTHSSVGGPLSVIAWVRPAPAPAPAGVSILRVQFSHNGRPTADAEMTAKFAQDVQRRTLMVAAPSRSIP